MVLPEALCAQLSKLAATESRTVSNMAKVLIQEGIKKYQQDYLSSKSDSETFTNTEGFRSALEAQENKRLKGAPRRVRLYKP